MKQSPTIDMKSPEQPGEVVYTPVQISRFINFFIFAFRRLRKLIVVTTTIMLLAGGAYVIANRQQVSDIEHQGDGLSAAVHDITTTRTESRSNVCNLYRAIGIAHNNLVLGIVTRNFSIPIPEPLQADVDRQLVPVVDCSKQGIEDFYSGKTAIVIPEQILAPTTPK